MSNRVNFRLRCCQNSTTTTWQPIRKLKNLLIRQQCQLVTSVVEWRSELRSNKSQGVDGEIKLKGENQTKKMNRHWTAKVVDTIGPSRETSIKERTKKYSLRVHR